ncbi:MAG: efflux RND transporter permease subunit [Gammaproteobacteria bacterium]|nr:efflux RND transporter permease subunit [Gammaproteobacteria bacterium]
MAENRNGWIAWFANNAVAANLLMVGILLVGIYSALFKLPLEVFPDISFDVVTVRGSYSGASPEEVERQITIEVETVLQDLDFIETMRSRSQEGSSSVSIELRPGTDIDTAKADVQSRVDTLSFQDDIDTPTVVTATRKREVISLALSGDLSEQERRDLSDRLRDYLLANAEISQVEIGSIRNYEIGVEISPQALQEHSLTLESVAAAINRKSGDFAAGNIKTQSGEILIRTIGQAQNSTDFANILIKNDQNGESLRLGDIATITDGFTEDSVLSRYNGKPAVVLEIYQVGDQSAIEIAKIVKQVAAEPPSWLPPNAELNYWRDSSRVLEARLNTLVTNAIQGAVLVFLLLSLFLRPSIAVWVTVGIPISFMGAFAMMPVQDVTVNMITLFAFIVVLGIVVDDAIVTGENIYAHARQGKSGIDASIDGTLEVAVPVTFGVLTTVVAFIPLFFFPGARGQIFAQIPAIVVPVLLFSLVESKLILPAHLSHVDLSKRPKFFLFKGIDWLQRKTANGLEHGIKKIYQPILNVCLRYRYSAVTAFVVMLVVSITIMTTGHLRFIFFPRIAAETASASIVMPAGTTTATTEQVINLISDKATELQKKYRTDNDQPIIAGILSTASANSGRVTMELTPPEERPEQPIKSSEIVKEWRKLIGPIPGAESLSFRAEIGRSSDPIDLQFSSPSLSALRAVAEETRLKLGQFPALFDIADTLSSGKLELEISLKPGADLMGITIADVAAQVRNAFFGRTVQSVQRGNDSVDVVVRYPLDARQSIADLERLPIPIGNQFVDLRSVATLTPSQGASTLYRIDRSRTLNVTADADKASGDIEAIKADINAWITEDLLPRHPDVTVSLEGEAAEQRDSFATMRIGALATLLGIYVLLAIPFKSYTQPFLVMLVIPFGVIGAVSGHLIMGMTLSIMSLLGILALTGVIVNDSLVLVDFINRRIKKDGQSLFNAVSEAGAARFRPVLLTSLTTFIGLTPLLLDTSTQAQFLIPMAVSLGFGILFATFITLILVPCNYLIADDIRRFFRRYW